MKYRLIKIKNEWLMKGEKMKAIAMFNNKGGVRGWCKTGINQSLQLAQQQHECLQGIRAPACTRNQAISEAIAEQF